MGPLNNAAIVHVIHAIGDINAEVNGREAQWQQALAQRAGAIPDFRCLVDVIAAVDPNRKDLDIVERVAATLAGFGAWSRARERPPYLEPVPEGPDLAEALRGWIKSSALVLHIIPSDSHHYFHERNVIEEPGLIVLGPDSLNQGGAQSIFERVADACKEVGFDTSLSASPDSKTRMGQWLLREERVVLYFREDEMAGWTKADIIAALKVGARVIYVGAEPFPTEFLPFESIRFPSISVGSSGPTPPGV